MAYTQERIGPVRKKTFITIFVCLMDDTSQTRAHPLLDVKGPLDLGRPEHQGEWTHAGWSRAGP